MLYRDTLGRLCAGLTVVHMVHGAHKTYDRETGALVDVPVTGYWYTKSQSTDGPELEWPDETTMEQIISDLEALGFRCKVLRDKPDRAHMSSMLSCTHTETQAAIDEEQAAQERKFAGARKGWVRFGKPPKGGKSMDWRDNVELPGVSCFRAEFTKSGDWRLTCMTDKLLATELTVMTRDAYRLWGEEIGQGPDGEPLLRMTKYARLKD